MLHGSSISTQPILQPLPQTPSIAMAEEKYGNTNRGTRHLPPLVPRKFDPEKKQNSPFLDIPQGYCTFEDEIGVTQAKRKVLGKKNDKETVFSFASTHSSSSDRLELGKSETSENSRDHNFTRSVSSPSSNGFDFEVSAGWSHSGAEIQFRKSTQFEMVCVFKKRNIKRG